MTELVRIFDTTLRDGEQSPGLQHEPRREARDRAPARAARRRRDRGGLSDRERGRLRGGQGGRAGGARRLDLRARAHRARGRRARRARARGRRCAAHPHVHRDERHPSAPQAADEPRGSARRGRPRRAPGARLRGRRRVLGRGRDAQRLGLPGRGVPRGGRGRRSHAERARHGRLHAARRVRGADPPPAREGSRRRLGDLLRALPQRPRPRRLEQSRGGARGRAPDRVHRERDRRARGQHLARRGGHGDQDPARMCMPGSTPRSSRPRSTRRAACSRRRSACRCSRTRRSSATTRSRTRPASTRTACSRPRSPTRS